MQTDQSWADIVRMNSNDKDENNDNIIYHAYPQKRTDLTQFINKKVLIMLRFIDDHHPWNNNDWYDHFMTGDLMLAKDLSIESRSKFVFVSVCELPPYYYGFFGKKIGMYKKCPIYDFSDFIEDLHSIDSSFD
jgi:hypothetical protein